MKVRMIVITAFEAKKIAKSRLTDNVPLPGLKKSSMTDFSILYVDWSGVICLISSRASRYSLSDIGRCDRIVNRTMASGGIAIRKLKEMAAALSFSPICWVCRKKNAATSYKGRPSKPGNEIFFDFRIRKATGGEVMTSRSNLVTGSGYLIRKLSSAFWYSLAFLKWSVSLDAKLWYPEKSARAQKKR